MHFEAPLSSVWELRGRHFLGSESAWLWLRNSGAAFASWEAVFQEQKALDGATGFRGRHLFTSTGRPVAAELKGQHFL